ncbi:MAG: YggS family pyridoxal phosphate-dependent enzyme [Limnohabitans sp.]|nr:YggS family pyridoxal phosphate-dependent enzyme [Limnohabitans sp.]
MQSLLSNLEAVRQRVAVAARDCGRPAEAVRLLAVSKTFPALDVQTIAQGGQIDFGENYIQEGVEKIVTLKHTNSLLVWHCIGPIQSNKTKLAAENFDWVHSIDRLKIAQRLSEQRPSGLQPLQVCLQVNVDGGATKSGVAPDEVLALAQAVMQLPQLQLRGLMTIPEPAVTFELQLQLHQQTKKLFDELKSQLYLEAFDTLSMGMTADLEAAIHAGATMVRVGTALFGQRDAV